MQGRAGGDGKPDKFNLQLLPLSLNLRTNLLGVLFGDTYLFYWLVWHHEAASHKCVARRQPICTHVPSPNGSE